MSYAFKLTDTIPINNLSTMRFNVITAVIKPSKYGLLDPDPAHDRNTILENIRNHLPADNSITSQKMSAFTSVQYVVCGYCDCSIFISVWLIISLNYYTIFGSGVSVMLSTRWHSLA
jgi:hypothetical protein